MSKRIVAGITMALMAALAGCQAPASTAPQSQMTMRQLPKASKVVTNPTDKAAMATLKTVVEGGFGDKARSLLYNRADVDRLTIQATNQDDANIAYADELTELEVNNLGVSTSTVTVLAGTYAIQVVAWEDGNPNPIGSNESTDGTGFPTPVVITLAAGETGTAPVRVQLSNSSVLGASLNTAITLLDGGVAPTAPTFQ